MQRIELLDTTLRDGAQGEGVDHSLSDKRKIALALDRLGVPPVSYTHLDVYKRQLYHRSKKGETSLDFFCRPRYALRE